MPITAHLCCIRCCSRQFLHEFQQDSCVRCHVTKRARRSRRAFPTTETELKLIAAAAIMGLSRAFMPNSGTRTSSSTRFRNVSTTCPSMCEFWRTPAWWWARRRGGSPTTDSRKTRTQKTVSDRGSTFWRSSTKAMSAKRISNDSRRDWHSVKMAAAGLACRRCHSPRNASLRNREHCGSHQCNLRSNDPSNQLSEIPQESLRPGRYYFRAG